MATTEHNALIRAKDASGNSLLIYPITKAENVDGLDESLAGKADASHDHDSAYDSKGSAETALSSAKAYADELAASKSQVQIITWEDND